MKCELCGNEIEGDNWHQVEASGLGDYVLCQFCFESLDDEQIPEPP